MIRDLWTRPMLSNGFVRIIAAAILSSLLWLAVLWAIK